MPRPIKRAFGINDPFAGSKWRQPFCKCLGISQCRVLIEELELAAAIRLVKFFEEAPMKQSRKHVHWQKPPGLQATQRWPFIERCRLS